MRDYSNITTNSTGAEQGGNITVTTDNLIMRESNISANAKNSKGGRVIVNTEGLFVTPDSKIEATSELGEEFNGVVEINNPNVDPSNALVKLPITVIDPVSLIAQNACKQSKNSQFIVTDRGGLSPTPNDLLTPTQTEVELCGENSPTTTHIEQSTVTHQNPHPRCPLSHRVRGRWSIVGWVRWRKFRNHHHDLTSHRYPPKPSPPRPPLPQGEGEMVQGDRFK